MKPRWPLVIGVLWIALVSFLGLQGVPASLRPPLPQIVILGLSLALVLAYFLVSPVRQWADSLDPRQLIALHLLRLVGIVFLIDGERGILPQAFTKPAGIGDIIVAVLAAVFVFGPPITNPVRRVSALVWNLLGFVDILLVVANAARLGRADPASMRGLLTFPMCLVPLGLVPWIIASHVVLFRRLRR